MTLEVSTASDPIFNPTDFRIGDGVLHFGAASESPFLHRHDEALLDYARDKSIGWSGRIRMAERINAAREKVSRLFKVNENNVGFVSNVVEGVSLLAESIDVEPGQNICVDASEFPSAALPFVGLRASGVEIRVARGNDPDRFARVVDEKTRIISTSTVSYITGERLSPEYLRELADANGALLILDVTQEAGALPVDLSIADFAFSSCYKFLLGCTGVAVAYWNQARYPNFEPSTLGWYSVHFPPHLDYDKDPAMKEGASRFSRGNVSHPSIYVLDSALDYLQDTTEEMRADHIQALSQRLLEGLDALGIRPTTPWDESRRGPSVCFTSKEGARLMEKLGEQSIIVINIDETIRVSLHGYNYAEQIDGLLDALEREWRG